MLLPLSSWSWVYPAWLREWDAELWSRRDRRLDGRPLMDSPWPTLAICLAYVYVAKVAGPRFMSRRRPYNLRHVMVVYNLCQIAVSSYLFYMAVRCGFASGFRLKCAPVDYSHSPIIMKCVDGCYLYYLTRFSDFLDTIWILARKKFDHVSVLHVYHHASMPLAVWPGLRYVSGGHSAFFGLLNSFVHMVMYTYYLIASLGPSFKHWLAWKRQVTLLQIAQFCVLIAHEGAYIMYGDNCNFPKPYAWYIGFHGMTFLVLFVRFYLQAYVYKSRKKID